MRISQSFETKVSNHSTEDSRREHDREVSDAPLLGNQLRTREGDADDERAHDRVRVLEVLEHLRNLLKHGNLLNVLDRCRPAHVVAEHVRHQREKDVQLPAADTLVSGTDAVKSGGTAHSPLKKIAKNGAQMMCLAAMGNNAPSRER